MTFEIDKKTREEIRIKAKEQIGDKISLKTKKVLSKAEKQIYRLGKGLYKEELEKNIIIMFNLQKSKYDRDVKIPIETFFETMESGRVFINFIKEAIYLLEQLPDSDKITKQDLSELDNLAKKEGRELDNDKLQNIMKNFSVIVSQKSTMFDKINNLPRGKDNSDITLRLEEIVNAYSLVYELLAQLLYDVIDQIIKFLLSQYPNNKEYKNYRRNLEKDKITIEKMISILEAMELFCGTECLTGIFNNYLKKDIRNMVFHRRYEIKGGQIREKDLSKEEGELITLTPSEIFDEFVKIIVVFDCIFLNLYYMYLPELLPHLDKLRVIAELEKE